MLFRDLSLLRDRGEGQDLEFMERFVQLGQDWPGIGKPGQSRPFQKPLPFPAPAVTVDEVGNRQNLRGHVTDWSCLRPAWFIRYCRNRPGFLCVQVN